MAKKTKKLKKDTLKQEENVFVMIKNGIKSPQFPLIVGVFLFLFAVFCFISFISFFYTNIADYDLVKNVSARDLLSGEQNIGNWGGNLGAFLSYYIISHTFGIGALGFLVIMILFALRLFKVKNSLFSKWIVAALVIMLWVSCVMGFFVVAFDTLVLENFAGIVGVGINQGLVALMGVVGCAIVLLAFTITIPMLLFGVKYLWVRHIVKSVAEHTLSNEQEKTGVAQYGTINERDNKDEAKDRKTNFIFNIFKRKKKIENTKKEGSIPETKEITSKQEHQRSEHTNSAVEQQQLKDLLIRSQSQIKDDEPVVITRQAAEHISVAYNDTSISKPIKLNPNQEDIVQENIPFTVKQQTEEISQEDDDTTIDDIEEQQHYKVDTPYDPYKELNHYKFPTIDLLIDYDKNNSVISERELLANKNRIIETLLNYKIEISSIEATVGPTVTLYEIIPAPGIRISKIKSLEDDIALSLSALGIRIIAPIPGKGTIGIEVPNSKPQVVSMKSMLESPQFLENKFELPIVIGRKIDNTPYTCDLAKMPHLLMAGATGQGKSVGLNAIISSLLFKKHPCDLKFIFVDPKKVELSLYSKLEKHYLAKVPNGKEAVITDVKDVVYTLRSLCQLMDTRYELLKAAGCKKITEYNKKFIAQRLNPENGHNYMPYIVLVIDEFADLIMTAGKEIEKPICRLAQLARAVGIHLIIATQRPSVNIITGTIKANFPARAAFKVSSLMDSRTILDTKGAEQLIGRGDMLVSNGGPLVRLQCALIDTEEIEKVVDFISEQQGFSECFILPEVKEDIEEEGGEKKSLDDGKIDSKFEEAARLIVMTQQGSTSMIQRKLALGYNRAGRVMDQLESAGIVGPFRGSKARDVLVTSEDELNEILSHFLNKE